MKKIVLLLGLLTSFSIVQAQLLKKLKDKVDNTVNKKVDDATNGKKGEQGTGGTSENTSGGSAPGPATMRTYSKYDFVPGEKIIVFEDFIQDKVGDFPDKWNTNSAGEVVTVQGKAGQWFKITQKGIFRPEFIDSFPENFTLEFDVLCDHLVGSWGLRAAFAEMADKNSLDNWQSEAKNFIEFHMLPQGDGNGFSEVNRKTAGVLQTANSNPTKQFSDVTRPVHVAIWRQKERVRLYLNEEKAWICHGTNEIMNGYPEIGGASLVINANSLDILPEDYLYGDEWTIDGRPIKKKMPVIGKWKGYDVMATIGGIYADLNSEHLILISRDGMLPYIPITRKQYLERAMQFITRNYDDNNKRIRDNNDKMPAQLRASKEEIDNQTTLNTRLKNEGLKKLNDELEKTTKDGLLDAPAVIRIDPLFTTEGPIFQSEEQGGTMLCYSHPEAVWIF